MRISGRVSGKPHPFFGSRIFVQIHETIMGTGAGDRRPAGGGYKGVRFPGENLQKGLIRVRQGKRLLTVKMRPNPRVRRLPGIPLVFSPDLCYACSGKGFSRIPLPLPFRFRRGPLPEPGNPGNGEYTVQLCRVPDRERRGKSMLKYAPAVFAVGDTYQIMAIVQRPSLMWVKVGDQTYYDETNGILRSKKEIHRIIVPADVLNRAGEYTVCEREIIKRRAYFTRTEDMKAYRFPFHPVEGDREIRFFHIADTHSLSDEPVRAAAAFGGIDFLILNGDLLNHCENAEDFNIVYDIAARITRGEIPIVFSRGNHDMRGENTEIFPDYTPNCGGKTYYSFRLGPVWGLVLDCGEDKADDHAEYGGTVCCHAFRLAQTDFLRAVIANSGKEYGADGVRYRIVLSHIPFTRRYGGEFEIETELYAEWTKLIADCIKPHLMLHGHTHRFGVHQPGGAFDSYGLQPCPVVIGSQLDRRRFAGCGVILRGQQMDVVCVSDQGERLGEAALRIQDGGSPAPLPSRGGEDR